MAIPWRFNLPPTELNSNVLRMYKLILILANSPLTLKKRINNRIIAAIPNLPALNILSNKSSPKDSYVDFNIFILYYFI